mgnify:FL=1
MDDQVKICKDEANRFFLVSARISEKSVTLSPEDVISKVKDKIAQAIFEQVMTKLSPKIDEIFKDVE